MGYTEEKAFRCSKRDCIKVGAVTPKVVVSLLLAEIGLPLAEETVRPLVKDGAANLRQEVGTLAGPTHRLTFADSLIDQMAHYGLGQSA